MKLYTVAVYVMMMCMKEDNPGPKYLKGDYSRDIISIVVQGVSFCIWLTAEPQKMLLTHA